MGIPSQDYLYEDESLPPFGSELPESFDESQVTGDTSQVTNTDDKKSKMPLIIGGVLLVGAIGSSVVSKRNE